MVEAHARLNAWSSDEARAALLRCCGSERWAAAMLARRPFASDAALYEAAEATWATLGRDDYLQAFAQHPAIGDSAALAHRFASTAQWSEQEQAGARGADAETIAALLAGNQIYAARFGYTFIVCATGQRAEQMLAALQQRLKHPPELELRVAASQQAAITRLRLAKLAT